MLRTCSGRKPGLASLALTKLRSSNPAVVNRRNARLNCTITAPDITRRCRLLWVDVRLSPRSLFATVERIVSRSGARQKISGVASVIPAEKAVIRQLKPTSFKRGRLSGARRMSIGKVQKASENPTCAANSRKEQTLC
jgi:hypothetical protein